MWSLEHSYGEFPQVEDEFAAALDVSLAPRGPGVLFDLVAALGLPAGSVAVDVGCGEGAHSAALASRFGFAVTGVDPLPRHVGITRAAGVPAVVGSAERLPFAGGTFDLVWCRDVLVHVADLDLVYAEFRRVLRPGGRAVVYQMCGTDADLGWLFDVMGVVPASADPATTEAAISAAGLVVDQRVSLTTEWGEYAQETAGKPGRKLLHAARLLRGRDTFVYRFGQANYDLMLGDCLWHVYGMLGKLTRRAYVLSAPA